MAHLEQTAPQTAAKTDPELMALPAPPKARRFLTMLVMALTVAASAALCVSLKPDISYFFASSQVENLGLVTEIQPGALVPNRYVRVEGTPMASGTVRYTRLLGDHYAVFPLAGQRTIFVQVPTQGSASEREMSEREFTGRLVTFGQQGARFEEVGAYLSESMGMPVSSESFLLLVGEPPGAYGWSLGLALLCLLFVLVNLAFLFRWFRPLPYQLPDDA